MSELPEMSDYVTLIFTLFDQFEQQQMQNGKIKQGRPYTFDRRCFLVLFVIFQFRRISQFKTQARWLRKHLEVMEMLKWDAVPHRITFSRRYKALYTILQELILFIAQVAPDLDERFRTAHLVEDKSLFKARGPVWHQSDRKEGRIPDKLRNLDQEATWSKSGYHGWVYGYGTHVTCNEDAFPCLVQVETASISESIVIDQKFEVIKEALQPDTVAADNGYTKAMRIRNWAKQGIALVTPALKWKKGRFAQAYHRFIKEPDIATHIRSRRTSVEPFFDLTAKVIGTTARQKQLATQGLANVRTCLSLATLTIQIAMIINSIWSINLRNISEMAAAFS